MLITQIAALLHGNVAVQRCRMCNHGNLRRVLDLGHQPHSDDFLSPERLNEAEVSYPLRLVQCAECGLLQIDYLVSPSILYGLNYAYQTSANIGGVAHYHEMARHVAEKSGVGANSFAIDIGSNVGVVLEGFQRGGHRILGIEPAGEIVRIARENGIPTLSKFFSALVAKDVREGLRTSGCHHYDERICASARFGRCGAGHQNTTKRFRRARNRGAVCARAGAGSRVRHHLSSARDVPVRKTNEEILRPAWIGALRR